MIKNDVKDLQLPRERLTGIYRGVVEDNYSDPEESGRCKVRVFGVHSPNKIKDGMDGIATEDLPWAEPACPIFGGVSKIGIFGVPMQGAHVFLFFENGNILQPRYFATAPGIPWERPDPAEGFNDPAEEYPLLEHLYDADWNSGENPNSVYPDCFTIRSPAGHYIEMDSTPGNEVLHIRHKSGNGFSWDNDGAYTFHNKAPSSSHIYNVGPVNNVNASDIKNTCMGSISNLSMGLDETITGTKNTLVAGAIQQTCIGTITSSQTNYRMMTNDSFTCVTGGETKLVSENKVGIKSKKKAIAITSNRDNVEVLALLEFNSASISLDLKAVLAEMGGIFAKTNGYIINQVSGGIILIG